MTIVLENANEAILSGIKNLTKDFDGVKYTVESNSEFKQMSQETKELNELQMKLADKNRWQRALNEAHNDEEYKKEVREWEQLGLNDGFKQ
ncbi:hypothetical protein CHLV4142_04325 [Campylobacter helveticus]|uniref:Uncharacterized protein n=1 Tax=Campylobacter helveticus TaxID=28898 RepID=A0ABY3L255_9BACT|nr:hypothetical protein [Campylobacter helveticus]MCR2039371.1 hypothetical protein [Campylobacter helveticus]QBL11291.1 hypothetical protein A0073_01715 [Campylobacter helveticus]TNB57550.1 hypothetical protein FDW44_06865 [Campylobacter helveticus]TXK57732.1 hypothetical protein FVD16_04035 [Campylobacter helveticus]